MLSETSKKNVFSRLGRWAALGAVMAAGLLSLVGSGGGGGGGGGGSATDLTVVSTSPTNGATGTSVTTTVSATFSENLSTSPTFTLSGGAGSVTGAVTRSGATATFTPSAALAFSTTYTASVSGASGTGGGTQSADTTWTFTTQADPNSPPAITLSSSSLAFSAAIGAANPAAQTISISNSGGGTLSGLAVGTITYSAGASGWLLAPGLNSTSAPATLTVQPTVAGLAAGTYTATIPVTSGVASNSPRNVTVTLTVGAVLISGTADFQSVPNDTASNGRLLYGSITNRPIRGATVEVLPAAGGAALATGTTSATGTYSLTIASPQSVIVRVRAELKKTSGTGGTWDFTVRDNTSSQEALYVLDSAAFTPVAGANTKDLRASAGWGGSGYTGTRAAAPFAILDTVYDAKEKVLTASANATFPTLQLMWSVNNRPASGNLATGLIGTSFFQFSSTTGRRIYILGAANDDTDEFDRTVIAHEFGHYLQNVFSRDDSVGGGHTGGDRLDMRVAFSEGWGNGWSGIALNTPIYADSNGASQGSGFLIPLSVAPIGTDRGWYSESTVQYLIYTWGTSTSVGFAPVFAVLSGFPTTLPAQATVSALHHFAHYLKQQVPAQASSIDSLLASVLITVANPQGTTETNSGGITEALPVYRTHTAALGVAQNYCLTDAAGTATGEYNKLGANIFIRFTLAAAGTRTITAATTTPGVTSDPDFTLIRVNGTISDFISATPSSETTGPISLAAGTQLIILTDDALTSTSGTGGQRCFNVTIQ